MIFCFLPKAGLGNQLFVISKCLVFKELNGGEILYLNTRQLKIGPYLRNDRSKRNYGNFFIFQRNIVVDFFRSSFFKFIKIENKCTDPPLGLSVDTSNVVFSQIPHYSSYFFELMPYRDLIKERLFLLLNDKIRNQVLNLDVIDVAVHIRLGDFKKLESGRDFRDVGGTRTPLIYFIEEITRLSIINSEFNFFIFSDGGESELESILELKNTFLFKSINDIVDLYQMSKSKYLITSAGSTYSYWAAFLGDSNIIQHPDHITKIRSLEEI